MTVDRLVRDGVWIGMWVVYPKLDGDDRPTEGVVDFGDGTIMIFGEDGELVIKGLMDERWHDKPADILWTYTYTFIVDYNRSVRVRAREGI